MPNNSLSGAIAALVAAGKLVRLSCPKCHAQAILRPENTDRANYHCFCCTTEPTLMRED